ncbi:cytochrome c5 family protein [Pseudomonas sp. CCM 7891]|uniref:Cytochrome c5 family protein n=1 Tax=Pseudomonas karstica TaxID=1055468 RepID=A0A7X2RMQ3_9PSED|nr:c-type cytochrome [Pseudomonas karstica]MTD17791.1 cytochrome c5 family protein [Pseudomonas karstica]
MTKWLLAVSALMPLYSAQATQDPEGVYNRVCVACHAGQLPSAPKRGDQAAWEPRLAQGMDTLVQHVIQGFKAMPPRGLCMECSAEDYQAIIRLMASKPGSTL